MTHKTILDAHPAVRDEIGDLVTRRPLPGPRLPNLDPFLFLNHHGPQTYLPDNEGLPFGPHPHRGFETVTFILQGSLAHHDSGGASSVIEAGGVQWMTAGRGLVHAEISPDDFLRTGGPLEILQLWVNLPARLKMVEPAYAGLSRSQIPVVTKEGVRVSVIAGALDNITGPVQSRTGVFMSVVEFDKDGVLNLAGLSGRQIFLYVVRGELEVEKTIVPQAHLVQCSLAEDGLTLRAPASACALLGHADPIGEPIVARGPFVMNSVAEIDQAIADYRAGLFGDVPV